MVSTTAIRGLGEIALRVRDLPRMREFYEGVLGLPVLFANDFAVLLRIADGFEGHTRILGLFDRSADADYAGLDHGRSTVDHIAFEIAIADHAEERRRLEALGLDVEVLEFPRWGWRSMFFRDPEGTRVELVAYDPSMPRADASATRVR